MVAYHATQPMPIPYHVRGPPQTMLENASSRDRIDMSMCAGSSNNYAMTASCRRRSHHSIPASHLFLLRLQDWCHSLLRYHAGPIDL